MLRKILHCALLVSCWVSSYTSAAVEFKGVWQQGGVVIGRVDPGTQVGYRNKKLRLTDDGRFIVGLGRDAPAEATLTLIHSSGKKEIHQFTVLKRRYAIQKVKGVPQRTVEPNAAEVERSRREAQMAADARNQDLPFEFFAEPFVWPIQGPITGVYGSQRFYNDVPGNPHYGVDIARPVGTLVRAPAGGVVSLVHEDMFFSGGTLIVDHGHGLSSTFIHLSEILVKPGEKLNQGQPIAKVGKTGRATGPHLDWRMNWFEERVDPQLLVGPMKLEK